jgi:hypothetical protein
MDDRNYIEDRISKAVSAGILVDKRQQMPRGYGSWPTRALRDILGQCTHQNVGNDSDPMATARYHTSPHNHITPGRSLPSIVYCAAVPAIDGEPAWLVADPLWRMYSQSARDDEGYPGDENTHLIAYLVMGDFAGPGHRGETNGPTAAQLNAWKRLTHWSMETFGYSEEGLYGHYHFGKSGCPGYVLQGRIEEAREDALDIVTDLQWQEALLRWRGGLFPKYGADGQWGRESKRALISFQRVMGLRVTGQRDPFTELVLIQRFPPERGSV